MSISKFGFIAAVLALSGSCMTPSAQAKNYRQIESDIRAASSSTSTRRTAPNAVAKTTNDYQTGNIDRTQPGNAVPNQTGAVNRMKAGNPAKYQTGNIDRTSTGNPAKYQTGNIIRSTTGKAVGFQTGAVTHAKARNTSNYQTGNIDRTNTK